MHHNTKLCHSIILTLYTAAWCFVASLPETCADNAVLYKNLAEVTLSSAQSPSGWRLDREINAEQQALATFKKVYAVRALEIVNQVFIHAQNKIQINYTLFETQSAAEVAALKMSALVRNENIIFEKNNAVIEIISADGFLKQQALRLLRPGPVHDVLLDQHHIPEGWELWKVVLAEKATVSLFAARLGGAIGTVVNQFFRTGDAVVRINYAVCDDAAAAEKVYLNLSKQLADQNMIFKKGNVVIEIISEKEFLKAEARKLFS